MEKEKKDSIKDYFRIKRVSTLGFEIKKYIRLNFYSCINALKLIAFTASL